MPDGGIHALSGLRSFLRAPPQARQAQRRRAGHFKLHTCGCAGWRHKCLIRPTFLRRRAGYPPQARASAAPPGRTLQAPYLWLCRMAASMPYPAYVPEEACGIPPGPAGAAPPGGLAPAPHDDIHSLSLTQTAGDTLQLHHQQQRDAHQHDGQRRAIGDIAAIGQAENGHRQRRPARRIDHHRRP